MTGPSILVFDVETTGLQKDRDQIIELAVQAGLDAEAPRRCWRFCPSVPMDPASERIHGISAADLAAELPFAAHAAELHSLFTEAQVLIGYNVGFDLDMLQAEFARAGLPPLDVGDKLIVDPYRLWSAIEPRGLKYAHRRFVGGDFAGAHQAQADVAATAAVLCGMLAAFNLQAEWHSLAELCRGRRV